jgi:hypothetical protein
VHTFLNVRRRHMGQILHGSARTTEAVRRAIYSQESLRILACRQGVNPKTIASWRKRSSIADRRTGPYPRPPFFRLNRKPFVAFRRHSLLRLDDCLRATIPELTCTAACSGTTSPGCPRWTGARSSNSIRSATSISISRRFAPNRASSISCSL